MRRRTFIGAVAASLAARLLKPASSLAQGTVASKPHVAVIGAGAFGGWTALYLLRKGARVTLLDAWGAGHPLPSSGGATRVIRLGYADRVYVEMARRAMELWRENGERWGTRLYTQTGVLWMSDGHEFLESVVRQFDAGEIAYERLTVGELAKRYRQINPEGLSNAVLEPEAGFVLAGETSRAVAAAVVAEGGEFRQIRALPGPIAGGRLEALQLADGERLTADAYVFACGPWLAKLFPEVLGEHLQVTRQEVLYFTPPVGTDDFNANRLPVWADVREKLWYGVPGNAVHAFKIADDTPGPEFDPDSSDRIPTDAGIEAARKFLALRFPGMQDAPLVRSRVCQYTNTRDSHFVVDRHPEAANLWIVGGGSGHGLKHGPALGEAVAGWVLEEQTPEATFALSRFSAQNTARRGEA